MSKPKCYYLRADVYAILDQDDLTLPETLDDYEIVPTTMHGLLGCMLRADKSRIVASPLFIAIFCRREIRAVTKDAVTIVNKILERSVTLSWDELIKSGLAVESDDFQTRVTSLFSGMDVPFQYTNAGEEPGIRYISSEDEIEHITFS